MSIPQQYIRQSFFTIGTALLMGLSTANADLVYNDFATGLGTWTTTYGLTGNGFNLGWSPTGNASGVGGEVGGLVARYAAPSSPSAPYMPRILDTQSFAGGNMNLNYSIYMSGRMFLQNVANANSDLNFGYFNTVDADTGTNRLVMRMHSPSGGQWRFRLAAGQQSTSRVTVNGLESVGVDFGFSFTPSGVNDGSGSFTGYVGAVNIGTLAVPANSFSFDSFGLWVDSAGNSDPAALQNMFYDNVTFTIVPEPSTALLGSIGAALLLWGRRKLLRG
jgi:hypothetical protein